MQCRVLVVSRSGTPWTVGCFSYTIYKFDQQGNIVETHRRPDTWFKGTEIQYEFVPWRVRDGYIDDNDVLHTIVWNHVILVNVDPATMTENARNNHSFVEAIDLRTMKVLGRTWVADTRLAGFLPDGRVYGFTDDPAGFPRTDIFTVSITRGR